MIAQIPHHLGQLLSQIRVSTDRHHLEPTWRVSLPTSHTPEETAVPVASRVTCGGCPREQTFRPPVQESPSHRQHTGEGSAPTAIDAHQAIPLGTQMPGPQAPSKPCPYARAPNPSKSAATRTGPRVRGGNSRTFPTVATANRQLPEELGTQSPHTTLRPRSHTRLAPPSQTPRDRTTPRVRTHVPHSQRTSSRGPTCAPLAWRPRALGGEPRRPLATRPPHPPGPRSPTAGTHIQTRGRPGPRCRRRHAREPASEPRGRDAGAQTPDPPPPVIPLPTPTRPQTRLRTAGSRRRGADPRHAAARDPAADADTPANPPQNRRVETPGRRPQTRRCCPGPRCRRRHAQEPASEPLGRDAEAETPDVQPPGTPLPTPTRPRTRLRTTGSRRRGAEPRPAARDQFAEADTPKNPLQNGRVKMPGEDPRRTAARDHTADADTPKNPLQNHWVKTPGRRPQTHRPPRTKLPTPTRPRTRFKTTESRRRGGDPRRTAARDPAADADSQEPAAEPLGRDAEAKTPDPPPPPGTPLPTPTPKNRSQPRTVHTRTPPETLARQLTVAAAVAERPRGRLLRDTRAHKLRP
ncbi:putative uncharacterized protein ENSP00000383309 [Neofelis nebulosa]|uniref:putative uncharacterized protein ENSP00000383309 n=1 Tax=Neofelis nebulosa TaxID=61452 RepID=UPI002729E874|nr:putative uncharacterized protein ENSP00000383309 [Neofelis nebulosa]